MSLNWPHIHLMLNHFPVLGTLFGLALLVASMYADSEDVKRAALFTLFITAIFSLMTYLTGDPAEDTVKGLACVMDKAIEKHDDFATYALSGSVALGLLSGAVLLRNWGSRIGKSETLAVLVVAVAVSAAMAWTADLGGRIHHEELRPGFVHVGHDGHGDED